MLSDGGELTRRYKPDDRKPPPKSSPLRTRSPRFEKVSVPGCPGPILDEYGNLVEGVGFEPT